MYVDCKKQYNSSAMSCDRNIECVTTAGNAKWCTGPKMKDCYTYDPYFTQDFQLVTKVNFLMCPIYHKKNILFFTECQNFLL